jgi:predicted dehydrogenase
MPAAKDAVTPAELGIPESFPLPKRSDWRIGFIGFGGFANAHRRAYQSIGWPIVAVADPSPAARERARELTGAERLYESHEELLADESVDVVLLITQPTLREEVIAAAVAAGKPIMTEKPLARNLAECERIVALTEKAPVPVAVSQNYRWAGVNFHVRHIVEKGLVGRPFYASVEIHGFQDEELVDHPFYPKCEDFLTVQWNVHMIDLLRYWTGGEPQRVFACSRRMEGQNFRSDNLLLSFVDFGPGLTGHILHSELLRSSLGSRRCRIDGDRGSVIFDLSQEFLQLDSRELGRGPLTLDLSGVEMPRSQAGSMGDLLISVEEGREPQVSPRRNLATMRQVLAEEESVRRSGAWQDLSAGAGG